jgi:hypothetical protein
MQKIFEWYHHDDIMLPLWRMARVGHHEVCVVSVGQRAKLDALMVCVGTGHVDACANDVCEQCMWLCWKCVLTR